jgi:hypothetical protein
MRDIQEKSSDWKYSSEAEKKEIRDSYSIKNIKKEIIASG